MAAPDPQSAADAPADAVDVAAGLAAVKERIARAAHAAGREPGTVTLVAVTKSFPVAVIRRALAAGQRVFGENRVQEAEAKWPPLKAEFPDVALHLIGPLQSNKVHAAVALFDVIETVDRPRIARRLATEMARTGRRPACFVQVNTGEEPRKAGVLSVEADAFIEACRREHGLPLKGLMCIPPLDEEPAPHFALLANIAARHGLEALSMGMSADYETAITFGASHVRVGTAIFGPRGSGP